MTLQEAKDQVARDKNFRDWIDMCARDHYTNMEHAADKIALLYGDSQYNRGIEEAATLALDIPYMAPHEIQLFIEELKKLKR